MKRLWDNQLTMNPRDGLIPELSLGKGSMQVCVCGHVCVCGVCICTVALCMDVHVCICVHVFALLWCVCMVWMAKWPLPSLEKGLVAQHWYGAYQQGTNGPQAGGVLFLEGSVELGKGGKKQRVGRQGMMGQLPFYEEQPGFLWTHNYSGSCWTHTHYTYPHPCPHQGVGLRKFQTFR